jgi:hypothetical protein
MKTKHGDQRWAELFSSAGIPSAMEAWIWTAREGRFVLLEPARSRTPQGMTYYWRWR